MTGELTFKPFFKKKLVIVVDVSCGVVVIKDGRAVVL
jgi:hypothetical protein